MRRVPHLTEFALGLAVALTVIRVAFDNGGYFPSSWGLTAVSLAWIAAIAFSLRPPFSVSPMMVAFFVGLTALAGWEAASLAWTSDTTDGVQGVLRDLVYVAAVAMVISLSSRNLGATLRFGILTGVVVVSGWSLGTQLLPGRFGSHADVLASGRLYYPLGYWNAQGMLAVVGMFLALGVVSGFAKPIWRGLAAGALTLLAVDWYFTLSRGALISLVVGLAAMVLLDPRRVRTAAWALLSFPWPAIALAEAHRYPHLVSLSRSASVVSEGHEVAVVVGVITVGSALVVGGVAALEPKLRVPPRLIGAFRVAAVCTVVVVAAGAVVRNGGPIEAARKGLSAFRAAPPSSHASARLQSLSLNGRTRFWSVAWNDATKHPVAGSGAGSYEQVWLADRSFRGELRWASSLYLEVLAETGVIGLCLLVAALALPVVGAIKARGDHVIPALFGAYVAFAVHAGIDWDWQVTALGLVGIWCGCAQLGPCLGRGVQVTGRWRALLLAAAIGVAVVAGFGWAGNRDLSISSNAARNGRYGAAIAAAKSASRWAPWSYAPWLAIGQAKLALDDVGGARTAYLKATRRDSGLADAWFGLAQASAGRERAAAIDRASRLDPLGTRIAALCTSDPSSGCAPP